MRDAERRKRLADLIARLPGGRGEFIRRTGLSQGRVTQLLDHNEPFGERAAGRIALRMDLADDFFERLHEGPPPVPTDLNADAAPTPSEWQFLRDLRSLPEEDRQAKMRAVHAEAEKMRRFVAEQLGKYQVTRK